MTPRIETDRLVLRPMEGRDADGYMAMMADPEVAAFLTPGGQVRSPADEWRGFATMVGHWHIRGFGMFSVEEKATGRWVGRVGPWYPEGWPAIECGWGIERGSWGKGYAPEAANAAINWIFEQKPELDRIISVIEPTNKNSQTVAEKIGESNTGEIFSLWDFQLEIWAADRAQWLARFGKS